MPDFDTQSLPNGVAAGLDQFAKSYQNGKIADSITRVNPEILQQMGMSKEQFGGMSADEKTARISGAITAMNLRAQQAHAQQQSALSAAQLEDVQAQAAERQQQAQFRTQSAAEDEAVGNATTRYALGPQAAPAAVDPSDPDASAAAPAPATHEERLRYALQTPGLGGKSVPKLIGALNQLGLVKAGKGVPLGAQVKLPDGTVITGMGEANEPNIRPPEKANGLDIGESYTDKDGNTWFGMGPGNKPEMKAASDIKAAKSQGDTGRGRAVFMQSAPELARQLDVLEETIKKNNGNTSATTWDPAMVAALGQVPFQVAENYNKVVDPHSVNRPEKLRQDMEHLIPMGIGTRKEVTLRAIDNLRSELVNRVANYNAVEKDMPPNLPPSVNNQLIGRVPGVTVHPDTKFENEKQARDAGVKPGQPVMMWDPTTNRYRKATLN